MRKARSKNISANRRLVRVCFLDDTEHDVETEVDKTLRDVFEKVCHLRGLTDTSLLGLAVKSENGGVIFLDLDTRIAKLAPKEWKASNRGLGNGGKPLVTLSLMVQFYVKKFSLIRDDKLMEYYVHQMRKNFISYPFMYPDDRCFLLATYLMIATESRDKSSFDPRAFFPAWVVKKHGSKYIEEHMPSLIREFPDISSSEASTLAVSAMTLESSNPYNTHLYLVNRGVTGRKVSPAKQRNLTNTRSTETGLNSHRIYLGVNFKGLAFYEIGASGFIETSELHSWSQVDHISYKKNKMHFSGKQFSMKLFASSEELASNILLLCKQTYSHYCDDNIKTEAFITTLRHGSESSQSEGPETKKIYTGVHRYESSGETPPSLPPRNPHERKPLLNRYSIASTASSTTSGIVSDRPYLSHYNSQEELLGESRKFTSSQDSLLQLSSGAKSRPVQRATSEPSKKFEMLREHKVSQLQQYQIPKMSRATSDDTVRPGQSLITDHIYENVETVRNRLLAAAMAKPDKLSPRVLQDTEVILAAPRPLAYSTHRLLAQSQGALNHSLSNLHYLSQSHLNKKLTYSSQLNIMRPSPSMEQLLRDYRPPPSYNERHERMREQLFGKIKQEKSIKNTQKTPIATPQPQIQPGKQCMCAATRQQNQKILQLSGLPLITALCNDKDLKLYSTQCENCRQNAASHQQSSVLNRPISWHSDTFTIQNALPKVSNVTIESY